jgi:hypothetical protein
MILIDLVGVSGKCGKVKHNKMKYACTDYVSVLSVDIIEYWGLDNLSRKVICLAHDSEGREGPDQAAISDKGFKIHHNIERASCSGSVHDSKWAHKEEGEQQGGQMFYSNLLLKELI